MKIYMFRLIFDNSSAEYGLAVVRNLMELFWLLDEFADPYQYQFCEAQPGDALCTQVRFNGHEAASDIGCNDEEIEKHRYDYITEVKEDEYKDTGELLSENVRYQGSEDGRIWRQFKKCTTTVVTTMPSPSIKEIVDTKSSIRYIDDQPLL
jgi:hypothetical protein